MANGKGKCVPVTDFLSLGSKIIADDDCNHEIRRHLLLARKTMTNLDSVLKKKLLCRATELNWTEMSSPTNQRVSTSWWGTPRPSLSPDLCKPFPRSHRVTQVFRAWVAHSPYLAPPWAPCFQHCTFLHNNPCQQVGFTMCWMSRPKFGLVTVPVTKSCEDSDSSLMAKEHCRPSR